MKRSTTQKTRIQARVRRPNRSGKPSGGSDEELDARSGRAKQPPPDPTGPLEGGSGPEIFFTDDGPEPEGSPDGQEGGVGSPGIDFPAGDDSVSLPRSVNVVDIDLCLVDDVEPGGEKRSAALTAADISGMKGVTPIVAVTCYDYPMARLLDQATIDLVIVDDTLGATVYGHEDLLLVTLDDMIRHCRAVSCAVERPLLVADLPFMTFECSVSRAVESAGLLVAKGRARAVKLRGTFSDASTVRRLVQLGIPVVAHLAPPRPLDRWPGGIRSRPANDDDRNRVLDDALALEDAGAFAIVLDSFEPSLATRLSGALRIPTIGRQTAVGCDGEILSLVDLLGLSGPSGGEKERLGHAIRRGLVDTIARSVERIRRKRSV